jgi:outer membrane lipoprotein-sorting protein
VVIGRRPRSSVAAVAILALLATGCATLAHTPRQRIGPEAREVIDRLQERWRGFSGLRTLADIRVQRGTERQQLHGVLLAKPPASVRFEALSPMGQPLFLATIRDGRITAYDATTNEAMVGPATAETAARVMSLPFEPTDLVAILAGHALPPDDVRGAEVLAPDAVGPSVELVGDANRRRIWLEPGTGLVRQMELTGGRAEARIRYDRDPDGEFRGFDLTAMLGWVKASVRYEAPTFGADVPDELFTLTLPKSAKIQDIR